MSEITVIKVKASSVVKSVAGSIAKSLEQGNTVELISIGAGALNQATKAVILARGFIASRGYDLIVRPGFFITHIDGDEKTCIKQNISKQ